MPLLLLGMLGLLGLLTLAAPPGRAQGPAAPSARPAIPPHLWHLGADAVHFAEALALAGLSFDTFRFDPASVALWGGDKYRLPLFDICFREPLQISPYARDLAQRALRQAGSVSGITYLAQSNAGVRVRDNFYSSYLSGIVARVEADGESALARALATLGAAGTPAAVTGTAPDTAPGIIIDTAPGAITGTVTETAPDIVPPVIQRCAAVLLHAMNHAARLRDLGLIQPLEALGGLDLDAVYADMYRQLFWDTRADDDDNPDPDVEIEMIREMLAQEAILDAVDYPLFYKGANLIALAIDHVKSTLDSLPPNERDALGSATFEFAALTPLGWIRLNGAGTHTYGSTHLPSARRPASGSARDHDLLIIDTGGDDRYYQAGATTSARLGMGVAIDLAGDDTYASPDAPIWQDYNARVDGRSEAFEHHRPEDHVAAFGAGILGYGFLVDLAGNDSYATPFGGQGCGLLGQGVLLDASGDDTYTGDTGVQGSGTFGTGILADLAGHDRFHCYHRGQGYAYTLGAGILVDAGGDDEYIGETENVKYRWFGTHSEQLNMSQGFGYGRRADMSDGHSWAGGVGMLVDGGMGNDRYHADIFALGSAYWYALGILYDDGGDDDYSSYAYSLASPPHFAVGVVIDEAGDDLYRGHSSRACGFGRDFSIGWFEEGGGNDRYYCNDSAFGAANVNGIAVFWDKGGDDLYVARDNSFGQPFVEGSGSPRDFIINAGLFLDAGGKDAYRQLPEDFDAAAHEPFEFGDGSQFPPISWLRDGVRHSWRGHLDPPMSTGAALDVE